MSGEMQIKTTCQQCGFKVDIRGPDVAAMVAASDGVHDLLRPECPIAVRRAPAAAPSTPTD